LLIEQEEGMCRHEEKSQDSCTVVSMGLPMSAKCPNTYVA